MSDQNWVGPMPDSGVERTGRPTVGQCLAVDDAGGGVAEAGQIVDELLELLHRGGAERHDVAVLPVTR